MGYKVVITGTTGMVGKGVLLECIDHPRVETVLLVNRSSARIKGKTENDLLALGFKNAYMFRPGYIQPQRGIKSKTGWYQALYTIFWPIYLILKHFPSTATNTTNMGLAMINSLNGKYPKSILETKDINQLSLL